MITENINTLKIHKITKEQYKRELIAGNINENEFYLTPDEPKYFIVTISGESSSSLIADKTYDEIKKAYDENYLIIGIYDKITHLIDDINDSAIILYAYELTDDGIRRCSLSIDTSNVVTLQAFVGGFSFNESTSKLNINTLNTTDKTIVGAINELDNKLPTPDTTDSNKVLTVNSDGTTIWSDLLQPDWEQNDETALDYIKNKPETTADKAVELLFEVGMIDPMIDDNGSIYIEENNVIYTL